VTNTNSRSERTIRIGMPQMAMGCMSENWLLKELASLHYDFLCDAAGRKSNEIEDSEGRRLYPTIVRVRLELEDTLVAFGEGDDLSMSIRMTRFGRSTLQSTIALASSASRGIATLMSTFSCRTGHNNTSLAKSEPAAEFDASIEPIAEATPFFTEYSDIRKRYGRQRIAPSSDPVYPINPFTDSNGANLLYFASYQSSHDFLSCVRRSSEEIPLWQFRTTARDICYFSNCDLDDKIGLVPVSDVHVTENVVQTKDLLFRASDGDSIAFVSCLKKCAKDGD
jgi:probable biosynthetic protein (TIGR04098 family)